MIVRGGCAVAGVGLQYGGVGMIEQIKAVQPSLKTWETETPCGGV